MGEQRRLIGVMETLITFFVLSSPRRRRGGRLARCAAPTANLLVFFRSLAGREEVEEGGWEEGGGSEWRGEENWPLLLMAIHQLQAIVSGPSSMVR